MMQRGERRGRHLAQGDKHGEDVSMGIHVLHHSVHVASPPRMPPWLMPHGLLDTHLVSLSTRAAASGKLEAAQLEGFAVSDCVAWQEAEASKGLRESVSATKQGDLLCHSLAVCFWKAT